MLLQRVLTAIPLGILIIWIILFQSSEVFFWMLMFITAVAGYEWAKLSGLALTGRVIYPVLLCAICWLVKNHASQFMNAYIYTGVYVGIHVLTCMVVHYRVAIAQVDAKSCEHRLIAG